MQSLPMISAETGRRRNVHPIINTSVIGNRVIGAGQLPRDDYWELARIDRHHPWSDTNQGQLLRSGHPYARPYHSP